MFQQDPFGNFQNTPGFSRKRPTSLSFYVKVIADMTVIKPIRFFVESYAEGFHSPTQKSLKKN